MKAGRARTILAACTFITKVATAQTFTFDPPGTLVPTKSGKGRVDSKVYAPTMRFPMEEPRAYANSQVYARGGIGGDGGSECDSANFGYPWHDNYCEIRDWEMPLCPAGTGHQGQDIRATTCDNDKYWIVAAADGSITSVGSYSVYLTTSDGTRFDYLHMSSVQVKVGDRVTRGQHLGKVSNVFGGNATTHHLHFNIRQTVAGIGEVYVPPYLSLVDSYKRLLSGGEIIDAGTDAAPPTPPKPVPEPQPEDAGPAVEATPPAETQGCGCSHTASAGSSLVSALAVLGFLGRRRRRD